MVTHRSHHADPPGRLDAERGTAEEPEREVHASNGHANETRIKECEEELQHRWEAIMALRDVVMKQRDTIRSLKAEQQDTEPTYPLEEIREETVSKTSTLSGSDTTPSSSEESESCEDIDQEKSPPVSFGPSHRSQVEEDEELSAITCEDEESSIDSSDFLKMEYEMQAVMEAAKAHRSSPIDTVISFERHKMPGQMKMPPEMTATTETNAGITSVIESIQEQASHVDAAIALDKLQTTKNELQSVTSDLRNRNEEVSELKSQVKVLEEQIATLELERDLHAAEATRAREDLKDCIQYLVKLKASGGEEDISRRSSMTTEPASNVGQGGERLEPNAFVTPEKSNTAAVSIRPAPSEMSHDNNEQRRQAATPSTQVTEATGQSARFLDDQSISSSFSSDGYPRRNLALCFWNQRGKETADKGPAFERMDEEVERKQRVPLFRRRQKNQKKKTKDNTSSKPSDLRLNSSQRAKVVNKLNQSLAETNKELAELRTRLHSITRYHDNAVISLQQNAGSNNTEYEADMINQLSFLDREKKTVMAELRQKEGLTAMYQKKLAQLAGSEKSDNNDCVEQETALV